MENVPTFVTLLTFPKSTQNLPCPPRLLTLLVSSRHDQLARWHQSLAYNQLHLAKPASCAERKWYGRRLRYGRWAQTGHRRHLLLHHAQSCYFFEEHLEMAFDLSVLWSKSQSQNNPGLILLAFTRAFTWHREIITCVIPGILGQRHMAQFVVISLVYTPKRSQTADGT